VEGSRLGGKGEEEGRREESREWRIVAFNHQGGMWALILRRQPGFFRKNSPLYNRSTDFYYQRAGTFGTRIFY
jgi:hypothetical protein